MNAPSAGPVFNIIYIRDTVRMLLPFAQTLVRHAPGSRFRLVTNGCTREEEAEVKALCASHKCFSFHSLESRRVLRHGEVLNILFAMEDSPWFAFLDSDIFAIGPYMEEIERGLREHAAIFSCLPVWHEPDEMRMPPRFAIAGGRYLATASGNLLGVSYLAAYRSDALRACMRRTGADFMRRSVSEISPALRATLREFGSDALVFDTGKILNVMLQQEETAAYLPLQGLVHIGAVSGVMARLSPFMRARVRISRMLPLAVKRVLRSLLQVNPSISREEAENWLWLGARRRAMQDYIVALVQEGEGAAGAHLQGVGQDLASALREVGGHIAQIHREYGSGLVPVPALGDVAVKS